jgi:branched-chain amino acid transport system substrate-binding protein
VIFGFADDIEAMMRALNGEGFNLQVYTSSAVDTAEFMSRIEEFGEGLVFPRVFDPADTKNPLVPEFVNAYRAKFESEPDLYSAYGYDAARLIALTLRREGIEEEIREVLNFRLQMSDERFNGLTGRVDFSQDDNEVIKNFLLYKIVDGKAVFLDDYEKDLVAQKYRELQQLRSGRSGR